MRRGRKKKMKREDEIPSTERRGLGATVLGFFRALFGCFCVFPRTSSSSETSDGNGTSVSNKTSSISGTLSNQTKKLSGRVSLKSQSQTKSGKDISPSGSKKKSGNDISQSDSKKTSGSSIPPGDSKTPSSIGVWPSVPKTPSVHGTSLSHTKSSSVSDNSNHHSKKSSPTGNSLPKFPSVKEGGCEEEQPGSSVPTAPASLSFERFTFHQELGSGSYGKVILAMDTVTNELLAMKFVEKSALLRNPERVMVERNVLEAAQSCNFLTHAFAAFQTKQHVVYLMEFVQGGTLKDFINEFGSLTIDIVRFLAAEIVCGLRFLHHKGIVHRDLKPTNILLDHIGHIKIADFGCALENIFGEVKNEEVMGTTGYMSPEVIKKEYYNASVDWWALGVIMYYMAVGKMPIWNQDGDGLLIYPQWFSPELIDLLHQLWTADPVRRLELAQNIQNHAFFNTIDWSLLELGLIPPPFYSEPPGCIYLTNEEKPSSEEVQESISEEQQGLFNGFSFVSPYWWGNLTDIKNE